MDFGTILDYILDYQQKNDELGSIEQICLQVPVESLDNTAPLWLIPVGHYPSEEYYRKLSKLDWGLIFSQKGNGVAFFQQFLASIKQELQADFVIIDSRTGITEIAGLCTQQLADEVVMLSSLSSESIEGTKHIKQLIQQSKVAKALDKSIDVKVVVSRVPKPKYLEEFKKRCCKDFEIEETKLFFIFSCLALKKENFLVIYAPEKDNELVSNYVGLFYGLNLELANENIRAEIERAVGNILLIPPEEAEKRVWELVALHPHPEAYRTAMHFFQLAKKDEMRIFAWKLFELMPNDEEVQNILVKSPLANFANGLRLSDGAKKDAIRAIETLWQKGNFNPAQIKSYAGILEDAKQYSKSLEVALELCKNKEIDERNRVEACSIAARNAQRLGKLELVTELIEAIPPEELDRSLAFLAMKGSEKIEDFNGAFEIAKKVLLQDFNQSLLERAASLAHQLQRVEELEEALKSSKKLLRMLSKKTVSLKELRQLGLHGLASQLEQSSHVNRQKL